jgi:hypothetical protein
MSSIERLFRSTEGTREEGTVQLQEYYDKNVKLVLLISQIKQRTGF